MSSLFARRRPAAFGRRFLSSPFCPFFFGGLGDYNQDIFAVGGGVLRLAPVARRQDVPPLLLLRRLAASAGRRAEAATTADRRRKTTPTATSFAGRFVGSPWPDCY